MSHVGSAMIVKNLKSVFGDISLCVVDGKSNCDTLIVGLLAIVAAVVHTAGTSADTEFRDISFSFVDDK